MDPVKLLASNAFFDNVSKGSGAIDGLADTLGQIGVSIGENSGDVKSSHPSCSKLSRMGLITLLNKVKKTSHFTFVRKV